MVLEGVPTAFSTTDLLNKVAVKLPLFWPENIETWFVQAKSQFCLRAVIVSQPMFEYCIQAMMQEVAVKVLDLISNPPIENPYQHLKDRLLRVYALNDYACAEAIVNLSFRRNAAFLPHVSYLASSYELPF